MDNMLNAKLVPVFNTDVIEKGDIIVYGNTVPSAMDVTTKKIIYFRTGHVQEVTEHYIEVIQLTGSTDNDSDRIWASAVHKDEVRLRKVELPTTLDRVGEELDLGK